MNTSHRVSQYTRTEISTDIIVPLRSVFFHRSHCSNIFGETRAIAALPGEAERKYLPTEGSDNKCLPPEEWLTSPISASAPTLGSPLGLCVGRGGRGRSGPWSEVWQATIHRVKFMTTYWVSQGVTAVTKTVVDILNILLRMFWVRLELKDNTKLLLFLQNHIILRYKSISKISIQRRNNKQPCLKTIGFTQPWRLQ